MSLLNNFLKELNNGQVAQANLEPIKPNTVYNNRESKFSLMKDIYGNDLSAADVHSHLSAVDDEEDAVDTVAFGLETSDGEIVKVYVNADQSEEFEAKMSQLLGKIDDIDQAIETLSAEFDIVSVVKPGEADAEDVDSNVPGQDPDESANIENKLDEPLTPEDMIGDQEEEDMDAKKDEKKGEVKDDKKNNDEEDETDSEDDSQESDKDSSESEEEKSGEPDDLDGLDFDEEDDDKKDDKEGGEEGGDKESSEVESDSDTDSEEEPSEENEDSDSDSESDEEENIDGEDSKNPDKKTKKKKPEKKTDEIKKESFTMETGSLLKEFIDLSLKTHETMKSKFSTAYSHQKPKNKKDADLDSRHPTKPEIKLGHLATDSKDPQLKAVDSHEDSIFYMDLTKQESEIEKLFTTPIQKLVYRVILGLGVSAEAADIRKSKFRKDVRDVANGLMHQPQARNILNRLGKELALRRSELDSVNEKSENAELEGTIRDQLTNDLTKKIYSLILGLGTPEFILTFKRTQLKRRIKNLAKIAVRHSKVRSYINQLHDMLQLSIDDKKKKTNVKESLSSIFFGRQATASRNLLRLTELSISDRADLGDFTIVEMGEVGGIELKARDFTLILADDEYSKLIRILDEDSNGELNSENLGKVNVIKDEDGSFTLKPVDSGSSAKYPFGVLLNTKTINRLLA